MTDAALASRHQVYDDGDVVDWQDYARLQALRDNLPAQLGGRGNAWRLLAAEGAPWWSRKKENEGLPAMLEQVAVFARYLGAHAKGRLGDFVLHLQSDLQTSFHFRYAVPKRAPTARAGVQVGELGREGV